MSQFASTDTREIWRPHVFDNNVEGEVEETQVCDE